MLTKKQVRSIRGAAYNLVSASVRQAEMEVKTPDSKTAQRLANRAKAHREEFERILAALAPVTEEGDKE